MDGQTHNNKFIPGATTDTITALTAATAAAWARQTRCNFTDDGAYKQVKVCAQHVLGGGTTYPGQARVPKRSRAHSG